MVSEEIIGERVTAIMSGIVPTYNSEAEVETYPYAVYMQDVTPILDKTGIRGYQSAVTVNAYSKVYDEARGIMVSARAEIDVRLNRGGFRAMLTGCSEECNNGVWAITDTWTIRQINALTD